jgi:Predicted Zn-dependent hydrolases of the beta-lactamase fold
VYYQKITFTFLPAVHWSQRAVFDKNKSLWGSWMISSQDCTIYFAGDTAWGDHFAQLADQRIDYALLPIGPCEPHEWMSHTHISAKQAVDAFIMLGAQQLIPMHWGTFLFGNDQFEDPLLRLKAAWQQSHAVLQDKTLQIMKVGQTVASKDHLFVASLSQQTQRVIE